MDTVSKQLATKIARLTRNLSRYNNQRSLVFQCHSSANDSMMRAKWNNLEQRYAQCIASSLTELGRLACQDSSVKAVYESLYSRFVAIRRAYAHQLEISSFADLLTESTALQTL